MFLFFVWFIFWYLDRENAFPKIMLKLWSLCFHADVLSILILNRKSFQFFSARNFYQKTCLEITVLNMLGNHSVHNLGRLFFFFQFRQCGFRDAYQSCVHALIPAHARTWFVTTFRHYWSICPSVLSVPCGCQNFSRLAKTWSPFLQTRMNLWIWCCTVLQVFFSFKRASYYIIVCNWDKLSQWSRDNAPMYAQFTLQVSVDAMSSAFVTTSMCSVSKL